MCIRDSLHHRTSSHGEDGLSRLDDRAIDFIMKSIEPSVKKAFSKHGNFLGWEYRDFVQEAYVILCGSVTPNDPAGAIAYYATAFKNRVSDALRSSPRNRSENHEEEEPSYDDTAILDLTHTIRNQMSETSQRIVMGLLNGETQRSIIKEVGSYRFYEDLRNIRREVASYYVRMAKV